jgi:hypothetical protein
VATRRWTMNSNLDYYVRTNETATVVELELSYKRRDGRTERAGSFHLDLPALERRGLVTRRGDVYDIKICRDSQGYWLGVRESDRAPLADFG